MTGSDRPALCTSKSDHAGNTHLCELVDGHDGTHKCCYMYCKETWE